MKAAGFLRYPPIENPKSQTDAELEDGTHGR
ncbi:hypothetical protein CLV41_10596 [Roseibium marinum]|uniref:Uncharacterized protein n=1 Tax=Roseibium marinum TaxID=281252 RepID=A0A2S3UT65_9HYPH|nr:hypothetical protein CLV41_10596 [Roseibium marinum]